MVNGWSPPPLMVYSSSCSRSSARHLAARYRNTEFTFTSSFTEVLMRRHPTERASISTSSLKNTSTIHEKSRNISSVHVVVGTWLWLALRQVKVRNSTLTRLSQSQGQVNKIWTAFPAVANNITITSAMSAMMSVRWLILNRAHTLSFYHNSRTTWDGVSMYHPFEKQRKNSTFFIHSFQYGSFLYSSWRSHKLNILVGTYSVSIAKSCTDLP